MTHDGSLSVLISHLRELANELSMESEDDRAAHVLNAILDLRKAFSVQYQAELDAIDRKRLEQLRTS